MWRLLLFIFFPAVEIYLLIKVGSAIGALNMVLWIFASAIFGIWYARAHSEYSMMQMRADISQGKIPKNALVDSVFISIGGILLVLPGLITDALGLLLLFPPTRHLIGKQAGSFLRNRTGTSSTFIFTSAGGYGERGSGCSSDTNEPVFDATLSQNENKEGPRQVTIIESSAIDIEIDNNINSTDDGQRTSDGKP